MSKKEINIDKGDLTTVEQQLDPPDVVVFVGEGTTQRKFGCNAIDLCRASDYFAKMLNSKFKESSTKEIRFPTKDANEWEEVYKFIDDKTKNTAEVTLDNLQHLLPLFHEFNMSEQILECDKQFEKLIMSECDVECLTSYFETAIVFGLKATMAKHVAKMMTLVVDHGKQHDHLMQMFWTWMEEDILDDWVKEDLATEEDKANALTDQMFHKIASVFLNDRYGEERLRVLEEKRNKLQEANTMLSRIHAKLKEKNKGLQEELEERVENTEEMGFFMLDLKSLVKRLWRGFWG